jgi:hypothetical protein
VWRSTHLFIASAYVLRWRIKSQEYILLRLVAGGLIRERQTRLMAAVKQKKRRLAGASSFASRGSGWHVDLPLPSPQAEQTAASENQSGQTSVIWRSCSTICG